ncbi:hypothetical protein [Bacillus smithii]|uniref:hypothetical protein n=1 Tax=Bacillus smithii TaxID=1479 RepID=UPI002E20CAA9|nr:hypothetical protein [Bacillus smithii]MED4929123.1 hypothetical protein [Bacillus smithii]
MNYIDRYIKRLEERGTTLPEALINTNKNIVDKNFSTSPSYTSILLNGVDSDAIVNKSDKYDEKVILFRPNTIVFLGDEITIGNKTYLLTEVFEDVIYVKGIGKLCNSTFRVRSGKKRTIIGQNELGRPEYDDTYEIDKLVPCIVKDRYFYTNMDEQLPLPEGRLIISMQYQVADNLKIDSLFEMYNETYKITDINYTSVIEGKGIMQIIAERKVDKPMG